jgi:hypothetical protein
VPHRNDMTGWAIGRAIYAAARMRIAKRLTPWEQYQCAMARNIAGLSEMQRRAALTETKYLEAKALEWLRSQRRST